MTVSPLPVSEPGRIPEEIAAAIDRLTAEASVDPDLVSVSAESRIKVARLALDAAILSRLNKVEAKAGSDGEWTSDRTFETTPTGGRVPELEAQLSAAIARGERLEAELAGWKRVAVIAALPLEAMRMGGSYRFLAPSTQACVDEAVVTIRMAVTGHSLPPEGDMDVAVAPARAALACPVPVEGGEHHGA